MIKGLGEHLGARLDLRPINNILFVAVCILGGYLVLAPILPQIAYYARAWTGGKTINRYVRTDSGIFATSSNDESEVIPKNNTLVVEKIGVDGQIHEGNSPSIINLGIWRRPKSSAPPLGGNTVLVAHRYLYTLGPNTFYNLDKVAVGDTVVVYWDRKKYTYEVSEVSVTGPSDFSIESQTTTPLLTLWTCTPLFTARDRLVVRAKLRS